ncbi:MAG: hypothetical protein Q9220_000472 [cf. Caloplaca sp. 1 TL-2023]
MTGDLNASGDSNNGPASPLAQPNGSHRGSEDVDIFNDNDRPINGNGALYHDGGSSDAENAGKGTGVAAGETIKVRTGLDLPVINEGERGGQGIEYDGINLDEKDDDYEQKEQRDTKSKVLKLSPAQIEELISSPDSLPRIAPALRDGTVIVSNGTTRMIQQQRRRSQPLSGMSTARTHSTHPGESNQTPGQTGQVWNERDAEEMDILVTPQRDNDATPSGRKYSRTASSQNLSRRNSSKVSLAAQNNMQPSRRNSKSTPRPLHFDEKRLDPRDPTSDRPLPSPMPQSIPIPPFSLPTYLQLELSSHRPSPLYIHRSRTSDFPYESSKVKMERLSNFLRVGWPLECLLWFGFFACLDAWLFSFTILPLRFLKAVGMLIQSWTRNLAAEVKFIGMSLYFGSGRLWRRRRASSAASSIRPAFQNDKLSEKNGSHNPNISPKTPHFSFPAEDDHVHTDFTHSDQPRKRRKDSRRRHRRAKSTPSLLSPDNKADIVKGFLILVSCIILMQFDASRMYHGIRGQAAIKLYVIYNVLEVLDRLLSAIGQDILECLISKEALERKPNGRSKVLRPFWLFMLALAYNLAHSTALFYQAITLNVAVNSYSNALLTLLMSNQFVEIKGTVFKKFEKENLFQLTCADVVERFQLWLMLTIIALRNLIETGGLDFTSYASTTTHNIASSSSPLSSTNIIPRSFNLFWNGFPLLQPFVLVLGSEAFVDWIKHCYITKFNNTKPTIYDRFHDILAKDYYSNAFADQNLTRRLGLPVIPLSCLFIRAAVQTYHMFLATHLPPPVVSSTAAATATSLSVESSSATTIAAVTHIDQILRRALGRSTFGAAPPSASSSSSTVSYLLHPTTWFHPWTTDDLIALATMSAFFLILYLVLLTCKLLLGMLLLRYARHRYRGMKAREQESVHAEGRRVGGWGVVEVDEDKRRQSKKMYLIKQNLTLALLLGAAALLASAFPAAVVPESLAEQKCPDAESADHFAIVVVYSDTFCTGSAASVFGMGAGSHICHNVSNRSSIGASRS